MNLTFRQLKVFEAVARHLSYTQAAQELHLTQPAVSMQVKQLEENVGLPLFDQVGKRVYLTEAGREMHHYCRTIAAQLEEVEAVIGQLKGMRRGHLQISVATTANHFATRLLAAFVKCNEGVTFSLDVTNREKLLGQLADNDCDLAIMGRPPADLGLVAESFMENPLVVVAASGHPLAGRGEVPLKALQNEVFAVREQGSGTRIAMERFFKERGVQVSFEMEMSSNEAIKQAVEAGLGLGLVSIHTLELELETGRLVILDVEDFPIFRHWYVVYRKGKRLAPIAQAFRQFVHKEAQALQGAVILNRYKE